MKLRNRFLVLCAPTVLFSLSAALFAQTSPVKPGLWESQVTSTSVVSLPPEVEARLAALPAAQQAQVRSMMGGAGGSSAPTVTTRQVCIAPSTTFDTMLSRTQQSSSMQCSVSNRSMTATGISFDIACTSATGGAKGHTDIRIADPNHATSTTHMTITATAQGHTMTSTVDTTTSAKFLSADCGDVKPYTPPPGI